MNGSILQNSVIFLGAALICVPIAKRLGIGSVIGYLFGGILIGPFVLGWVGSEGEDIMHAAEFGVVMMLFLIGLELNPQSFWNMRKSILGMGGAQMVFTSLLIFPFLRYFWDFSFNASVAIALSFAMSSTAIVLQTLKEKGLSQTQAGRASFAVLLLQDIAVIPILALLPLLAIGTVNNTKSEHDHPNFISDLDAGYATLVIVGVVLFIYLAGRFLINPFLHFIAKVRMRELFTISALFIVIGVSWLMEQVGISPALGAFMAGVVLANSEFRHELESNVEPFKGVLLGLFFTAVGSTINFDIIFAQPLNIISFVLSIMFIKALVLLVIGQFFRLTPDQDILFALLLAQLGEFAFVLLATARQLNITDAVSSDFLMASVTVSMILSPILLYLNEKFIAPRFGVKESLSLAAMDHIEEENEVIIAGFGHFGSTVGRFLRANGVYATVLDSDSDRVMLLRKMGFKVFYGDATRLDLLVAAGAEKAKVLICAIDDPEKSMELVDIVQKHFPHLKIFMRTKNRYYAYEMLDRGIENVYRETLETSVNLGVDVLHEMGLRKYTLTRKASEFIKHDKESTKKLAKSRHDHDDYILRVKEEIEWQEKLLSEDITFFDFKHDTAWEAPSRQQPSAKAS